jgi:hypothetical protein
VKSEEEEKATTDYTDSEITQIREEGKGGKREAFGSCFSVNVTSDCHRYDLLRPFALSVLDRQRRTPLDAYAMASARLVESPSSRQLAVGDLLFGAVGEAMNATMREARPRRSLPSSFSSSSV